MMPYGDFVGKGEWWISLPDTKINVDFQKEDLDSVIEKLNSIQSTFNYCQLNNTGIKDQRQ